MESNCVLTQPFETVLAFIDGNIGSVSHGNYKRLSEAINHFEEDPELLIFNRTGDSRLGFYVDCLVRDTTAQELDTLILRAKIFYTLAKVVTWKKFILYLPTNIYQLPQLLRLLPIHENDQDDESWYVSFMVLSWIYMLVLSPFRLEKTCDEIYTSTAKYKKFQTLKPIVCRIHAQLLVKSTALFDTLKNGLDPLTVNYLLKSEPKKLSFDRELLQNMTKRCLEEVSSDPITNLKLLPKLFKMNALREDWEEMEIIISWFLSNMNNSFTNVRFKLARCFATVLNCLINDLGDIETAKELAESRLREAISLLEFKLGWDLVDCDLLHTNLLIIAELSGVIMHRWPEFSNTISKKIVPPSSTFQQLRINFIKGSQIKDASNFICWSIAKQQKNTVSIDREVTIGMFLNLLMLSLFDHDLAVRRSANAALQEVLGRCITPQNILHNETVLKIIELPISNLSESYSKNALRIYKLFSQKESYKEFLHYIIDWLITTNLFGTHDLQTVRLTIDALYAIFSQNRDCVDESIVSKLQSSIEHSKKTRESSLSIRLLALLIKLSKDNLCIRLTSSEILYSLYSNYISSFKCNSSIKREDSFSFAVVLNYWDLLISSVDSYTIDENTGEVFFHIVKAISEHEKSIDRFVPLVKQYILHLSRNDVRWPSKNDESMFWTTFEKYIGLNNTLICAALPELKVERFLPIFYRLLPSMDCERKSQILDSLNDRITTIVMKDGKNILSVIIGLLNDYTITQQGDVGRLVRTSTAKLIESNMELFIDNSDETHKEQIIKDLVRLSGEQVIPLKVVCYNILCRIYGYDVEVTDNTKINHQLLKFQHIKFNGTSQEFWSGYLISAGAIHFSDSEVTFAVDEFLKYYSDLGENEKLKLCNCLIHVVPSANEIVRFQGQRNYDKMTGAKRQNLLKITISHLNFWIRIMESGIDINSRFNFEGVYAKLFNLHLLKSNLLKITVVRLFPFLIETRWSSVSTGNEMFTNTIIKRLLVLLQREFVFRKSQPTGLLHAILEALAQIYINRDASRQLGIILAASRNLEKIVQLSESKLLI